MSKKKGMNRLKDKNNVEISSKYVTVYSNACNFNYSQI